MGDTDSCDLTRLPKMALDAHGRPDALSELEAHLETVARYEYWGKPDNARYGHPGEVIGSGLRLSTAKRLDHQVQILVRRCYPEMRFFGHPFFGLRRTLALALKNGPAEVGDFVARKILVNYRKLARGSETWQEGFVVARVLEVKEGRMVCLEDRTGIVKNPPQPYWVFPAALLDSEAAAAEVAKREARHREERYWGGPWGFHHSYDSVAHMLADFHRADCPEVMPTDEALSRIMGYPVSLAAKLADRRRAA